jgi:hypothetical protein
MCSIEVYWKLAILPRRALVLPIRKNFMRNHGAFALGVHSFLIPVEPLFCLPHKGEGKQTEPDSVGCDVFDDDCVAQFKKVCQVSVGILTGQSTEWTGMHHGDQPGPKFKILVTDVNSGPDRHVGNSRDGELTE